MTREEIIKRFTYEPTKPGQADRYKQIQDKVIELALLINDITPVSREQSTAYTHLDIVRSFAIAAIARNE